MSTGADDEASRGSGTRMRRPPAILLLVVGLIVLAAVMLLTILLTIGDQTDTEEQPEPDAASMTLRSG